MFAGELGKSDWGILTVVVLCLPVCLSTMLAITHTAIQLRRGFANALITLPVGVYFGNGGRPLPRR